MEPVAPVFAVSGSQALLRQRFVRGVVEARAAQAWAVTSVNGETTGAVERALDPPLFAPPDGMTLVVVTDPDKGPLELYEAQNEVKNPDMVLLLHLEGDPDGRTRFAKFLKKLGLKRYRHFPKPEVWDEEQVAASFCVEEAKRHGRVLQEGHALALVQLVGTDLGFLSFEILKIAMLAAAEGAEAIKPEHLRGGMAQVSGASMSPIRSALVTKDKTKLLRALLQVYGVSASDPTMWVCRSVGPMALEWLGVAEMAERGVPHADAAARLRLNPWYYQNKLLPQVGRWKVVDVVRLVKAVAESERALLRGHLDPWSGLVARLLLACG